MRRETSSERGTVRDACGDAVDGASAVRFQVELFFEGVVDRLDQPAYGFE
jgi:hypothetical protein